MRLLIIGGTRFLGRHVAEQALARGHALTLLHRGRSGSGLFPQARHLIADRDGDLPLWLPQASHGMLQIDLSRARAQGLRCRPLVQTLADTAAWAAEAPATPTGDGPPRPAVGLSTEREALLRSLLT